MTLVRPTALIVALTVALTGLACSAPRANAQVPIRWTATAPTAPASPGEAVTVRLTAAIDDGWHIYAIDQRPGGPVPTRITLAPGQPFSLARPVSTTTAPHIMMDESFGMNVSMHEKNATFVVPTKVGPSARAGMDTVHVNVRYQACNARLCLPPQTARLTAAVRTRDAS